MSDMERRHTNDNKKKWVEALKSSLVIVASLAIWVAIFVPALGLRRTFEAPAAQSGQPH
jgi:hypothetical protein